MAKDKFKAQFDKLVDIAGSQDALATDAGAAGQSTAGMWLKNRAISRAAIKALKARRKYQKARINWAVLAGL